MKRSRSVPVSKFSGSAKCACRSPESSTREPRQKVPGMTQPRIHVRMVVLLSLGAVAGCVYQIPPTASSLSSSPVQATSTTQASSRDLRQELVGVILSVENLPQVTGFTLCVEGGEYISIRVDQSRQYGFDLSHLYDHQLTREPVKVVVVESSAGVLVAESILDHHGSPPGC